MPLHYPDPRRGDMSPQLAEQLIQEKAAEQRAETERALEDERLIAEAREQGRLEVQLSWWQHWWQWRRRKRSRSF